jgi:hypothetical protein
MERLKIEPDRVPKEIVEFECKLRGIPVEDRGLTELRMALKSVLDKEYADVQDKPAGEQLDFVSAVAELRELGDGSLQMRESCEALEAEPDKTELRKVRSALAHWAGRLRRFACENAPELDEDFAKVTSHFEVTFVCLSRLRIGGQAPTAAAAAVPQPSAGDADADARRASVLADLSHSLSALGDPASELAELRRASAGVKFPPDIKFFVAVEFDEASQLHVPVHDGVLPPLSPRSAAHHKKFQKYNWKLEFSGESDSKLCLSEFLEQVAWKKRENSMTDVDLLRGANNFFFGAARQWFKANSASWSSFSDLRVDLIANFRTADYDDCGNSCVCVRRRRMSGLIFMCVK